MVPGAMELRYLRGFPEDRVDGTASVHEPEQVKRQLPPPLTETALSVRAALPTRAAGFPQARSCWGAGAPRESRAAVALPQDKTRALTKPRKPTGRHTGVAPKTEKEQRLGESRPNGPLRGQGREGGVLDPPGYGVRSGHAFPSTHPPSGLAPPSSQRQGSPPPRECLSGCI